MKQILKTIAMVVAIAFAVTALYQKRNSVIDVMSQVKWLWVMMSVTGLVIYQLVNAGTWKDVFSGLGVKTCRLNTMRVWIESECMKWLPGGIWGYGSRVVNARKLGVNYQIAATALAMELLLTIMAWTATASLVLMTDLGRSMIQQGSEWLMVLPIYVWVGIGVLGFIFLILIMRPGARDILKLYVHRVIPSLSEIDIQGKSLLRALGSYLVLCVFNGCLLWMIVKAMPGLDTHLPTVIGIGGMAWIAGFVAIGVPGGIGVREGALALLFAAHGPMESAVAAAVFFRIAQVIAELLVLCASLYYGWRISKRVSGLDTFTTHIHKP